MNCNVVRWAPFNFDRDRLKEGERTFPPKGPKGSLSEWATVSGVSSDDAMRPRAPEPRGVAVAPASVWRVWQLCNRGENVVMPD